MECSQRIERGKKCKPSNKELKTKNHEPSLVKTYSILFKIKFFIFDARNKTVCTQIT